MPTSTDIRDFDAQTLESNSKESNIVSDSAFDLIVGDVSFISIDKIINKLDMLLKSEGALLFLLKPQFEVGKGNTDKGIVKDEALIEGVIQKYQSILKVMNYKELHIFPSGITGTDGNKELFIYAVK